MNRSIMGVVVLVLTVTAAHAGFAAEATHVPVTPLAAANANLIARADRALRAYIAACSRGDHEAIARIVTSDAVVEYALQEPGTYLKVEAAALIARRSVNAKPTGAETRVSNLWIFPTQDSNVVFARYTIGTDDRSPAQDPGHLALLEMRGDRIFMMRHFRNLQDAQLQRGPCQSLGAEDIRGSQARLLPPLILTMAGKQLKLMNNGGNIREQDRTSGTAQSQPINEGDLADGR